MPMGRDLGFLPGDVNEKLAPWMQPIFDNLDFLFDTNLPSRLQGQSFCALDRAWHIIDKI